MKIVIFYPSAELGGAELLLARVASALSHKGFHVVVLDSKNAIIHNSIDNKNIEKIVVNADSPIKVDCDYIIAFSSHIVDIYRWIDSTSTGKVLFWSIHPFNTIFLPPYISGLVAKRGLFFVKMINKLFFRVEYLRREKALFLLNKNKAMVCMDEDNSIYPNVFYKTNYKWPHVPIPYFGLDDVEVTKKTKDLAEVNVFWIGRLVDFKVPILKFMIKKLAQSRYNIRLNIIGDGDCINDVKILVDSLNIKCNFYGGLENKKMHSCLAEHADIVFAMGTSALEAGARGIPTVVVDASYQEVNFNYEFNWLHSSKDFYLGNILTGKKIRAGIDFDAVITELINNGVYHAELTERYVRNNHSISSVVEKLIVCIRQSNLEYKSYIQEIGCEKPWLLTFARKIKKILFK